MAATYDPTLPTARDRMRMLLGDTAVDDAATVLLPDETYDAAITQWGETEGTARLADGLATKYAQEPSSIALGGDLSVAFERVKTWQALATRMHTAAAADATVAGAAASLTTLRPGETSRGHYRDSEYRRDEWVSWDA